ncbi:MAG TPA: HDOD domain-containing protein [Syntrophorhabdaceae bacterium]|jgi:HD-like signal output (HDOD) protein
MISDYIIHKLETIEMLPTFPDIVGQVKGIIENPSSSASDLAQHMDPSMVGEVLRIANSAYAGKKSFRKITSLEHAIAVIGLDDLLNIVLHMPFISMTENDDAFDRTLFITHSILCGAVAKGISAGTGKGDLNEVYLAGIEHDVGIIVEYRYFPDEWRQIGRLMSSGKSRIEAEREVFSVDHGHIGAALLDLWNTPRPIADCVRFHHQPELAQENIENVRITHLANDIAKHIDLRRDLKGFDEFAIRHRLSMKSALAIGEELSPSEEIEFIEEIYGLLKVAKAYIESITGEKDD